MAGHRQPALGPGVLNVDCGASPARFMPVAIMAEDASTKIGGTWLTRLAPGDPLTSPGRDLSSKIWASAPAVPFAGGRATRRAGSAHRAVRAGMGGRGLSHLVEQPLISAGSLRALARTGASGLPGSRTAN